MSVEAGSKNEVGNQAKKSFIEEIGSFVLYRTPKPVLDFFAAKVIDHLVDRKVDKAVENCILKYMAEDKVIILYANHQGHSDAIALANISGYLRKLAVRAHYDFQGLVAPMAASWVSGAQGEDLKGSYELLNGGCEKYGFIGIPVTREQDVEQHGMSRTQILVEMLPFGRKLREGYGIADLPEGSVQGGRHPEGTSREKINGMQKVKNNSLIGFFELACKTKRVKEGVNKYREPVFLCLALHGSFRHIESPEGGLIKPWLTRRGKWSLFATALGIPFGLAKIEANLLMPYKEDEIITDLGPGWRERSEVFNDYAMGKLKAGLPPIAWGVYS